MKQEQTIDAVMLFYNDLNEYQKSEQGQQVNNNYCAWLENKTRDNYNKLVKAITKYYNDRNAKTCALTWASEQERETGRALDYYIAQLYKEQN